MHKRNTALIALLLAAVVTLAVTLWTSVHRSDTVGILYFPAILLSVILSGRTREIGAVAEWSAFLVYTLFYLVVFLIIYVLLLEWVLLRRGISNLDRTHVDERLENAPSQAAFESLGRAIRDVESRRRGHWLLDNTKTIDLSESPDVLGARALEGSAAEGPAKGLLKEVRSRLVKERGSTAADAVMTRWKEDAATHLGQRAAAGKV
jgi:hypothetical protein